MSVGDGQQKTLLLCAYIWIMTEWLFPQLHNSRDRFFFSPSSASRTIYLLNTSLIFQNSILGCYKRAQVFGLTFFWAIIISFY